jgi:hypothetical protein
MTTHHVAFDITADLSPNQLRSWISTAAWVEGLRVDDVAVTHHETPVLNVAGGLFCVVPPAAAWHNWSVLLAVGQAAIPVGPAYAKCLTDGGIGLLVRLHPAKVRPAIARFFRYVGRSRSRAK